MYAPGPTCMQLGLHVHVYTRVSKEVVKEHRRRNRGGARGALAPPPTFQGAGVEGGLRPPPPTFGLAHNYVKIPPRSLSFHLHIPQY